MPEFFIGNIVFVGDPGQKLNFLWWDIVISLGNSNNIGKMTDVPLLPDTQIKIRNTHKIAINDFYQRYETMP